MKGDINIMPIFIAIYEDGEKFIGGTSYFKTKWMELPLKKIKRIFYRLPSVDYLTLDNYDSFFHMVEATKDWMRIGQRKITKINQNEPRIEYAYIMGKKGDKVISYRITLFNKTNERYRMGDVTVREFNISDERIKKLNPEVWR